MKALRNFYLGMVNFGMWLMTGGYAGVYGVGKPDTTIRQFSYVLGLICGAASITIIWIAVSVLIVFLFVRS